MHPTKNDLCPEKREKLVTLLNASLADILDLGMQAKQAHWNVKGPNFIALHQLFDQVAGIVAGFSDSIAERAVALGGTAEGTVQAVGGRSTLPTYPVDISSGMAHAEALANALAAFGKQARADIDVTDELGDAVTADLFTQIAAEIDKQLWFVEAHLEK